MSIKKVVENALNLLDKADDGIVLMNMYNEVVHPADAAFKGQVVYPYNAKSFIEESFRQNGIDLTDKDLRFMLMKLLLSFVQKPVKLTPTSRSKLTPSGRSKLTPASRSKLTPLEEYFLGME